MEKLSKFTGTILKLSLLCFILSFLLTVCGVDHELTSNVAGVSCGLTIILTPFFIIFKFSNAIIGLFTK